MARLRTCGYEEGSYTSTVFGAPGGSAVTFETTGTPHSGTYHLRAPASASNGLSPRMDIVSKSSGTVWSRVYWKPDTMPTSGTTTRIFLCRTTGGTNVFSIEHVQADDTIQMTNVTGSTSGATTATVSAGVQYRIEVEHVISATVGSLVMKLFLGDATDPVTGGTITLNGGGSGEPTGNPGQFYTPSATTINQGQVWYYDDFAINDETGSFQNSWCGPAKTMLLTPDDDTAAVDWTPLSGTDHFEMVNDLPGTGTPIDDDTTYVSTSVAGNEDWLFLSAPTAEMPSNATLILADTVARAKGNAVTPTFRVGCDLGQGDPVYGASYALTTSYAIMSSANHVVVDLASVAKSELVDQIQAILSLVSDGLEARVTAVWTNIEWLEAGVTDTPITPPTAVYSGP